MSLLKKFIDNIKEQNLFQKKDHLIIAVSGGVDSVALCELCYQSGFHFEIAHCNFQLRGEESDRDEKFVQSLGEKYDAKVFIKKFETKKYAEDNKVSLQVAARELRYQWFDELIKLTDNRQPTTDVHSLTSHIVHRTSYIVTAHHANDNIETLLMNFFKSTGINGLQGIPLKQNKIIRPLLFARKEEILNFAKENNLFFVEDSSNLTEKYTRNYFRNNLIPSVQKVFPQAEENLLNNIEKFKEIKILYNQAIDFHKKKLLEYKGNEVHIPVLKLLKTEPVKTIIYEIIKDYGFSPHQSEEVLHLLKSESGKYISSATHKIIKNRNWLIIAPVDNIESSIIIINENDKEVEFANGKIVIEKCLADKYSILSGNSVALLDVELIIFPLLLRKWKHGDYFYPLGMQKKKKLSRFFIDKKISISDKEKIWIIESNKKIIWIVGKRIDNRFKITQQTINALKISFKAL